MRLSVYIEKMGERLKALAVEEKERAMTFSGQGYTLRQFAISHIYDHDFLTSFITLILCCSLSTIEELP